MIVKACVIVYDKEGTKYTIPCHRHSDAYWIISQFLPHYKVDKPRTQEGFLDEQNNFYNRYDAYVEAFDCGQIIDQREPGQVGVLFSEDLY